MSVIVQMMNSDLWDRTMANAWLKESASYKYEM